MIHLWWVVSIFSSNTQQESEWASFPKCQTIPIRLAKDLWFWLNIKSLLTFSKILNQNYNFLLTLTMCCSLNLTTWGTTWGPALNQTIHSPSSLWLLGSSGMSHYAMLKIATDCKPNRDYISYETFLANQITECILQVRFGLKEHFWYSRNTVIFH